MKRQGLAYALGAIVISAPATAFAQDQSTVSLGVTGGSLGVGPEVSYTINQHVDARANITFLTVSHGFDSGDLHYHGTAVLGSGGIMIDYRPFEGGFFLSAGARIDKNKVRATASPNNGVTINGMFYTPAQIGLLRGYADFPTVAPTLSLGYSGSLHRGIKVGVEAGAMFMGKAQVHTLSYTGIGIAPTDLESERVKLQNDISKYRVYPILQLTAAYRFGSHAH